VRGGGAKQHAIRHDHRRAATGLQQLQEQRHEAQLGFLGLDDREQVFRRGLVIKRARERRIGQHEAVAVGIAGMLLRQRILVADVRVVDAVQRHVHRADPQHGAVEIEAVEQLLVEIVARFNLVKQFRMVVAQIFAGRDQETAGATGGIADYVLWSRRHHRPSAR
jgi:hypothetical protein